MSEPTTPDHDPDLPTSSPPPTWQFWKKRSPKVEKDDGKLAPLPYIQLFKYTDTRTRIMFVISIVFAAIHGIALPTLTLIFGRIIDEFSAIFENSTAVSNISSTVADTNRLFLILSFVVWAVSFIQLYFALAAANRIGNDLRAQFFKSLIRQHPAFFDDAKAAELTTLIAADIGLIQGGVGDKLATAIQYLTTFIAGIVVGLIKGWQLSLVVLAVTPLLLVSGMAFGNASAEATGDGLGSYAEAGGIASEAISLIRSVTSYSGQKSEAKRYESAVGKAYASSVKSALMSGMGIGVAMFLILATYALALWFGSTRIRNGTMSAGDVLLTFFALSLGASSLGTAGPAFKSFGAAQAAAPRVFNVIDAESRIDPLDNDAGVIPEGEVKGHISFRDIDFSYDAPSADGSPPPLVLSKFSLEIEPGSSEALVGKSGCGKSTVAKLIQRSYDPVDGGIFLDGRDMRDLNVRWLRSQIGVVAQMPSLFKLSIRENIALGAGFNFSRDPKTSVTTVTRHEPTEEEIIAAATLANAHAFINRLPEGYDTMLGERGAMLSGGQKQRVCIARALVRNPKILILDESTASLDTASERVVQEALERASSGRTTVTIAHRLSTVRNCDSITCIQNGDVLERGDHDALMSVEDGFYRTMYEMQTVERRKMQEEQALGSQDRADEVGLSAVGSAELSTTMTVGASITRPVDVESSDENEEKPKLTKGIFFRILKLNSPEWVLILFGVIGASMAGVVWPLASIPLVNMIQVLADDVKESEVTKWSVAFVIIALIALVGNFLQHGVLGVSGERLTRRVRSKAFTQLLRQEMGYFDMEENTLGGVTSLLSSDIGSLKGLTGDFLAIGVTVVASLVSAIIIAAIASWRITLVVLAIIPGVALGGYFEMQASAGIDSGARKEFSKANTVAAEAIDNVATVRSLGVEEVFLSRFGDILSSTNAGKLRKDLITGFAFGFSEFCQFLIWYATFKAGGDFLQQGLIDFKDMMQASLGLLFGAITLGNVSVFAPDVAASTLAAAQVFKLLDRKSAIDPFSEDGERVESVNGEVEAKNVYFEYPRRPDVAVLRGLSLDIESGKTLAIVGTSGHGKSTIIGLLQRFYAMRKGEITVDGRDIALTNVRDLRWQMGLVQQEPELFDRSVFDNIAYGLSHEEGATVTRAQVEDAARLANAHDFITCLPDGYDTVVGARGERLSGGQRQRVAIARSLVRQPRVLLLDEATSALDSASERAVQQALDQAGRGRTTIVVAHRLSTIKNADKIAVVRRGRIVECGTHQTLLRKNGEYARLIESQLTEV